MWTHFDGLRTKLLLKTFYDFLTRHLKKRKKSCFLKYEKNVKKNTGKNICTSFQTDNHASTSWYLQAGCPSCLPPNQQCYSTEGWRYGPLNVEVYQRMPKKAHPCMEICHITQRSSNSVHQWHLCTWRRDQKKTKKKLTVANCLFAQITHVVGPKYSLAYWVVFGQ